MVSPQRMFCQVPWYILEKSNRTILNSFPKLARVIIDIEEKIQQIKKEIDEVFATAISGLDELIKIKSKDFATEIVVQLKTRIQQKGVSMGNIKSGLTNIHNQKEPAKYEKWLLYAFLPFLSLASFKYSAESGTTNEQLASSFLLLTTAFIYAEGTKRFFYDPNGENHPFENFKANFTMNIGILQTKIDELFGSLDASKNKALNTAKTELTKSKTTFDTEYNTLKDNMDKFWSDNILDNLRPELVANTCFAVLALSFLFLDNTIYFPILSFITLYYFATKSNDKKELKPEKP